MEEIVYKYLDNNFVVGHSPTWQWSIYSKDNQHIIISESQPYYSNKLLDELETVFDVSQSWAMLQINLWVSQKYGGIDLSFYWAFCIRIEHSYPHVTRVAGTTIAQSLVPVMPMSIPNGTLFYLDFKYKKSKWERFKYWFKKKNDKIRTQIFR